MIRVAIVGTGGISSEHIKGYLAFPDRCEIVALADIVPEKAVAQARKFGVKADILDSHEALLKRDDIDLVSVCTPPYCHARIAIDLLNSGKGVLCEKPMGASLEECDRMIEAARKSGKTLSAVAQNRFKDPIQAMKKMLDAGKIGKVLHAQVDSFWWRGHSYYDLWWRGLWEKENGGCTLNHAVHHIDMLCWMMGSPAEVQSLLANVAHDNSEVEDLSIALLKFKDGAIGQITSSVVHHGEEQQLVFQGERARISAPWKVFASASRPNGFPERNETLERELTEYYESLPPLAHTGHEGQIDDVLTAIETGREPLIGGQSGRATIELITAIYKSGFERKAVELPIRADDAYYTNQGIRENAIHFYEKTACVQGFEGDITVGSDYSAKEDAKQ